MRDGNRSTLGRSFWCTYRFWTSYEGWKLLDRWSPRYCPLCFWTSYEGWKLSDRNDRTRYRPRFWTSYEGWKQYSYLCLNYLHKHVFELPMRDGNAIRRRSLTTLKPRFWTSYEGWKLTSGASSMFQTVTFLNFLWGMETGWTWFFKLMPSGFWTSYEGWKPQQKVHKIQVCAPVFELPMRDGNCCQETILRHLSSRFWTSYEGWKPSSAS